MIDSEVERLRRLRGSALQLREVARALGNNKASRGDALLAQGRCAAWRIARTVSGRLRAHPNARYQQDAGVGTLLKNSVVAAMTSLTATNRRQVMLQFGQQLKSVMRELDDARALTWVSELSEIFGRSQREIRALITAVECETRDCGAAATSGVRGQVSHAGADSRFLTI
jgi:hypothetical protein